jgi:hypothetical protein
MGFLKRIFGRNKWEQAADEVDMADAVWESVPYADSTPSMGASQAPPQYQPGAAPTAPPPKFQSGIIQTGAPAAATPSAPSPKFVPGAAPTAPPPKFQSGIIQTGAPVAATPSAPSPKFVPGATPSAPAPELSPEPRSVPTVASSAPVSLSRAPKPTREVIIDTVDEDDESMPEEFRGCRVVERTKPDGSVEIVYRGSDGFTVDEAAADFLISSYKEELATLTPKAAQPHPSGSYTQPVEIQPAVEPRLVGGAPRPEPHVSLTDEVIDELGFDTDLPPELRGARFVRRGGAFAYVTRDGSRLSKDKAESMMEQWEQRQLAKKPAAPLVIDELGIGNDLPPELRGAKFVNDGDEFLYITREGTRYSKDMAEGMMERWERDQQDRARASVSVSVPQPELQVSWESSSPQPAVAPLVVTAAPSGPLPSATPPPAEEPEPVVPASTPTEEELVGSSIGDALRKRAESGLFPVAATPAPLAATPAAPKAPTPVPIGVDPRFPVRAVPVDAPEDPTQETRIDGVSLASAQQASERIRMRVLDDEDAAYQTVVPVSRLQQACQAEVDRKRTQHRFEHMLELSAKARETLIEAWSKSSERKQRDVTKDLDQDMMVLGLFNPMTMREIDLAEFLSVSRLRSSERRRTIVTGEIARRVNEQVPGELHQFCMTRAFVDRVVQAAMDSADPTDKLIESVLTTRLQESVDGVLAEVTRRHGIWLPDLTERLVKRLTPLVRGLIKLADS